MEPRQLPAEVEPQIPPGKGDEGDGGGGGGLQPGSSRATETSKARRLNGSLGGQGAPNNTSASGP